MIMIMGGMTAAGLFCGREGQRGVVAPATKSYWSSQCGATGTLLGASVPINWSASVPYRTVPMMMIPSLGNSAVSFTGTAWGKKKWAPLVTVPVPDEYHK
jgi:hypothetical protein